MIGDIHGMAEMLRAMLDEIERVDAARRLYFVGDYVNRGPDSREVIELLLKTPGARFGRGNHDDVLDLILNGNCRAWRAAGGNRLLAASWFMEHGLDQTLLSYGAAEREIDEFLAEPSNDVLDAMLEHVPQSHREFVAGLELYLEEEAFIMVHGWWDVKLEFDGARLEAADARDVAQVMLWNRFQPRQIASAKPWRKPMVFGHTPVDVYPVTVGGRSDQPHRPIRGPSILLIDTAAALTAQGRLTAWCVEEDRCLQIDRRCRRVED